MGEFSEIFHFVWKDFDRILGIINRLSKDASLLISVAEEDSIFIATHKFLLGQSKDAIWKSINNEKKLKKYYYKLSYLIQPFDKIFSKVEKKYPKTIESCNNIYTVLNELIESEIPYFLMKMKETGNHYRIQVSKLIWKEDESAFHNININGKKQPKIFLSNNINSCYCKEALIKPCFVQNKNICTKSLEHFTEVFEFTALFFANVNNLSRNLLYIKLNLEKFGSLLQDLKKLLNLKLEYYKTLEESLKKSLSNEKLYRIIFKLKKIENILIEESKKLNSFISNLHQQVNSCKFTCVPTLVISNAFTKKSMGELLSQIDFEINTVIKFIKNILNPKKAEISSPHKLIRENYHSSFIFQIFHIRSLLLKKLQPYAISIQLQKSITTLVGYIKENSKLEKKIKNFQKINVNVIRDWKLKNSSISKNLIHSYNSSWDINTEENSMLVLETDEKSSESESESVNLRTYSPKNVSKTPELPAIPKPRRTVLLNPEFPLYFNERNSSRVHSYKSSNTQLTRTFTMTTTLSDKKKNKEKIKQDYKKIKHGTNGFLNHRIQRIQNNKSISPLTKIEYIREEFANQLKPLEIKLKNSFLKLKGRSTFIFSMR